jgi:hypothetical protein
MFVIYINLKETTWRENRHNKCTVAAEILPDAWGTISLDGTSMLQLDGDVAALSDNGR